MRNLGPPQMLPQMRVSSAMAGTGSDGEGQAGRAVPASAALGPSALRSYRNRRLNDHVLGLSVVANSFAPPLPPPLRGGFDIKLCGFLMIFFVPEGNRGAAGKLT